VLVDGDSRIGVVVGVVLTSSIEVMTAPAFNPIRGAQPLASEVNVPS
jgi:hypothetical protein